MFDLRKARWLLVIVTGINVLEPVTFAQKSQPAAGNFTYLQRLIFIKMKVNHQEFLLFLLDTGASRSAIDHQVAERLKLPHAGKDRVEGTAGIIDVTKAKIKTLSFERVEVPNLVVTVQKLEGLLAPPDEKVAGILGFDFLKHFSVEIDFKNRSINFSRRSAKTMSNINWVLLPVTLDNGIPRVAGILNGEIKADLRLDTGASIFETKDVYVNVTEDVWKKMTATDPALKPEKYFTGSGIGGDVKLAVALIDKLSIGELTISKPFLIVQPKAGYFARPNAVGFISNNLLEKHSPVVIDYLKKKIYLSRRTLQ